LWSQGGSHETQAFGEKNRKIGGYPAALPEGQLDQASLSREQCEIVLEIRSTDRIQDKVVPSIGCTRCVECLPAIILTVVDYLFGSQILEPNRLFG
jgi:hypothetical protein